MSTYIEVSRYKNTGNVLHHEVQTRERTADMCSQVDRPTISGLWRGSCHNRTKVHLGLACTGFGTARPSWWSSTMSSWRSLDAPNEWHPQALPEASKGPHLIQRMKLNLKLNLNLNEDVTFSWTMVRYGRTPWTVYHQQDGDQEQQFHCPVHSMICIKCERHSMP